MFISEEREKPVLYLFLFLENIYYHTWQLLRQFGMIGGSSVYSFFLYTYNNTNLKL